MIGHQGTRYSVDQAHAQQLGSEVATGQTRIQRYLGQRQTGAPVLASGAPASTASAASAAPAAATATASTASAAAGTGAPSRTALAGGLTTLNGTPAWSKCPKARSSPCGHLPLRGPTRWLRAALWAIEERPGRLGAEGRLRRRPGLP